MRDVEEERIDTDRPMVRTASKRWLIWPALVVAAFLAGLLPMWYSRYYLSQEFDKAKVDLVRQQNLNSLSAAAVYARRGEYETARQNASKFFTDMQAEMDNAESKVLTPQDRMQLPQLLASRDDIITLLSRADPAAAERLSNLYVDYRAATGGAQQ
jgi:hypothetical protein